MSFELSMVFKTSLLLFLTAVLAGLFRRSSASNCYTIWAAGLLSALVFPIVSISLPGVALPLLPNAGPKIARPAGPISVGAATAEERVIDVAGRQASVSRPGPGKWSPKP